MAVKAVLASLEGIAEALRAEYKKGEDGKFYLDVEGIDEHSAVGALKRAKDHEKAARQAAEEKLRAVEKERDTIQNEMEDRLRGALPKSDLERLEKSHRDTLAKREAELAGKISSLASNLDRLLVDNVATDIATKLAKSPREIPLLLPHIKVRLKVETGTDGSATTRVLDSDGKPSAATLDDLRNEIVANEMFASVIVGSKASGGGAEGGQGGGSAPKKIDLDKASTKDFVEHLRAKHANGGA